MFIMTNKLSFPLLNVGEREDFPDNTSNVDAHMEVHIIELRHRSYQ